VSTQHFSLDHLTDTEFEEFCFDLLNELGFINVKWRKGTGFSTSPSDRGRDIECQREQTDVDGHKDIETWFVECKHSVRGVPPDRIQAALAWATAERPHKLLLVASNFLSNPTHDFINDYEKNNHPAFKIRKWERTELERMTAGRIRLLRKYNISGELPILLIMHPAHISYIRGLRFNSLKYFFDVLDKLGSQERDKVLDWAFFFIIQPRFREPAAGRHKLIDRMVDELSYDAFKRKCLELVSHLPEFVLVSAIVNFTLQAWLGIGDVTASEEKLKDFKSQLQWSETVRKTYRGESGEYRDNLNFIIASMRKAKPDFQVEDLDDYFDRMAKFLEETIHSYPDRVRQNYDLYTYFCEHVVKELLIEDAVR
jgi:hypothetical protein